MENYTKHLSVKSPILEEVSHKTGEKEEIVAESEQESPRSPEFHNNHRAMKEEFGRLRNMLQKNEEVQGLASKSQETEDGLFDENTAEWGNLRLVLIDPLHWGDYVNLEELQDFILEIDYKVVDYEKEKFEKILEESNQQILPEKKIAVLDAENMNNIMLHMDANNALFNELLIRRKSGEGIPVSDLEKIRKENKEFYEELKNIRNKIQKKDILNKIEQIEQSYGPIVDTGESFVSSQSSENEINDSDILNDSSQGGQSANLIHKENKGQSNILSKIKSFLRKYK